MNAELLLRQFDRLSAAPDAVARLRTFIREFAIVSSADGGEAEGERVCVRDVADFRLGKMLDKAKNRGSLRRYLRNVNVRWNDFDLSDVKEMRFEDAEISEFTLRVGDVLICEGGEPGRAAVWDQREEGILFQKAIHRVRLAESVDPHYFVLVLRQAADSGRLAEYFTGTTFKHLTGMGLGRFSFTLPPLAEQQRIVANVDELMAVCDKLDAAHEQRERRRKQLSAASLARLTAAGDAPGRVAGKDVRFFLSHSSRMVTRPAHVADVRRAILDLAVTGRLVPQSPEDGPAERPPSHRTDAKLDEISFSDALPLNWQIGPLGRWFTVSGGIQKQPKRIPQGNARPYVGVANVQRGRLNLDEVKEFELFPGELDKYRLEKGDVLVVEGNGSADEIGRCALWGDEIEDCVHQNHIIRCRPRVRDLQHFTLLYLNSPLGMDEMRRLAVTTAGLFNLSVGKIQRILMAIPPPEEQHRIVAKVDELMAVCDELERSLDAVQAGRTRALEAVLHRVLEEAGVPSPALLEVAG